MAYDPKTDKTRWPACSRKDCICMAQRRNWTLESIEASEDSILNVICIFKGNCQFPKSRMDLTQGDQDDG